MEGRRGSVFRRVKIQYRNLSFISPRGLVKLNQTTVGDNTNLFTLSESAINAIKKPKLVQTMIVLKGQVIVDSD